MAHVNHNSGNNEWYTPIEIIKAARSAMGAIDLDPASCEKANLIVCATRYFDQEINGLEQKWFGRVWLNPPYSRGLIQKFANKVVESYASGDIEQACVLVNNASETGWYGKLMAECRAVCMFRSRIRFLNSSLQPKGKPLQGQHVLYFGMSLERFADSFSSLGHILKVM